MTGFPGHRTASFVAATGAVRFRSPAFVRCIGVLKMSLFFATYHRERISIPVR
jgi:hypothetical protein